MNIIETILLGILSSVIASLVFWVLTFKISTTNVHFDNYIEKSKKGDEKPHYKIRISNSGFRNLIEVNVMAKILVEGAPKSSYTYLAVGNKGFLPILQKKSLKKYILSLYISNDTNNEFKKPIYSNEICHKANNNILTIDDLFDVYGERVKITVFVFGNDCITGARKMFVSPEYTRIKIREIGIVEDNEMV